MSIGFAAKDQDWSEDMSERTIKEVALKEVSIVAFPASPTTSANMRSMDGFIADILAGELDPDEIRRAIAGLNASLSAPVVDYRDDLRRQLRRMS